VTGVNSHFILS